MQTLLGYNGIHKRLSINLSKIKYNKITIIQKYVIPILMGGRDIIARSPSGLAGSGKTTAIVISTLNCLLKNLTAINSDGYHSDPSAVFIVPTKQRVIHIYNVISRLSEKTPIKYGPLFDIKSIPNQKRIIQNGVHIVIATPESLFGFVNRGWITFTALQILVLDEVDCMFEMGFKPEIEFILNNQTMVSKDKRTTAVFSSTMTNSVKQLAMIYQKPDYVSIDMEEIIESSRPSTTLDIFNRR
ncbi:ATP-dependent RNA helicase laf-1-like [Melanaphis sacchari]|uniref:ATP-dependent RNA helicase laf-1-like n=1 Tax=Melanaphis sacchari TaxID=742174 RepID=UPI000DC1534E|nr:ATP-dependent RNA helicase laf-1-like [Melanaphis sacchari]